MQAKQGNDDDSLDRRGVIIRRAEVSELRESKVRHLILLSYHVNIHSFSARVASNPLVYSVLVAIAIRTWYATGSFQLAIGCGLFVPLLCIYYAVSLVMYYRLVWSLPDYIDCAKHWTSPGHTIFFAVADRKVIGCIAIRHQTADVCHLYRCNTVKQWRRQGVATRLIRAALAFCREQGYKQVEITTTNYQEPAHRLYARHGFKDTGTFVAWVPFFLYEGKLSLRLDGS